MLKSGIKQKLIINIDELEDRPMYNEIINSNLPFKSNLEIFTIAALIGKNVLNERKPVNKIDTFFRVRDTINTDDMNILKCLSILENDDFKIIINENEMFKISEEYARTGIEILYEWFENKSVDFETELAKILLKVFNENKKIQEDVKEIIEE